MFKRRWNDQMIIRHIMTRKKNEPLNPHYYANTYPDVYAAGQRLFGSWQGAIEACGLDYSLIRKYKVWSKTEVINKIKELKKKNCQLSSNYIQNNEKPLYMAAVRRFKSWQQAVIAAGLNYDEIRLRRARSPKSIKDEILTLVAKKEDMAYQHMRNKHSALLAAAMKKLGGGSWVSARKKCGIKFKRREVRDTIKS